MKQGQRNRQENSRSIETIGHGKLLGVYFKAMGSHEKVADGREYNLFLKFFEDPFDYQINYRWAEVKVERTTVRLFQQSKQEMVEVEPGGGGSRKYSGEQMRLDSGLVVENEGKKRLRDDSQDLCLSLRYIVAPL